MRISKAVDYYYHLRRYYKRPTPRKFSKKRLAADREAMSAFLDWCKQNGVRDPGAFMRQRFSDFQVASRRLAVPRITQMESEKLLERWQEWLEGDTLRKRADRARTTEAAKQVDSEVIKDLAGPPLPTWEALKAKHRRAHEPLACLNVVGPVAGYHPKSLWCPDCSVARQCQDKLQAIHGFDVTALRLGWLHLLPSHIATALVR
jgi:hypothetical protein